MMELQATNAGIRKGDQVKIMAGRDKGKTGRILSVNPRKRTVTVEHANIIKRHLHANPSQNIRGGVVEREGPINVSNVMLLCPGCGKHARLGYRTSPDGAKTRICRRCSTALEK